jgi:lysyl-tRNA synthetase class 2
MAAREEEIRNDRLRKRDALIAGGMNPYNARSAATHSVEELLNSFTTLVQYEQPVTLAGRVMAMREHGGSVFLDLFDGSGRIQIFVSRRDIGETLFGLLVEAIDTGDFIEVTGTPFVTRREVKTLAARTWTVLTKSLQAVPAEHFGLKDDDERFRKRYLDILLDDEIRELFRRKEQFWHVVRSFLTDTGFLEVETPTLELTTGGAEARPFQTRHNDFAIDVYLRISVGELWQKRLMAAGYRKVFEIGRAYRNEGTSAEHLQEFTNMEFYWAYADYRDGMRIVQNLYRTIAREVYGKTAFSVRGHQFDLADEWKEIDYVDEVQRQTGIDILTATKSDMQATLDSLGVQYEGENQERLIDTLWKYCRKNISGPAFLINHPKAVAPLAKQQPDRDTVEMFQPIIAGSEVGRGYSELNDPVEQHARFTKQQALLDAGDEEAMMPDWEFVEMLEYGMPPTCGFGFGERLFAFLENRPLRETQLFPLMRPREELRNDRN